MSAWNFVCYPQFFCGSFMKILPEANTVRDLEDQLMGIRIREVDTVAELKEMRQKVMELETNVCF